jgi:hypothetical protein
MEPAEWKSATNLNAQLADMLTSRGFTTVVDTGSNLNDTLPIRRRIERGTRRAAHLHRRSPALPAPRHPVLCPRQPATLAALLLPAARHTERGHRRRRQAQPRHAGADITKLFTGSWIARGKVLPMPLDIAKAAVERTHLNGRLVFSHPSNLAGTQVAIQSGVDVLAHAPDSTEGIDRALFETMVHQNMAMIPTLKMFGTTVT